MVITSTLNKVGKLNHAVIKWEMINKIKVGAIQFDENSR